MHIFMQHTAHFIIFVSPASFSDVCDVGSASQSLSSERCLLLSDAGQDECGNGTRADLRDLATVKVKASDQLPLQGCRRRSVLCCVEKSAVVCNAGQDERGHGTRANIS